MIIDLGEVSSARSPDAMESSRRPMSRRVSQSVALCLVALATLVASAVSPAPPMRLVASIPTDEAAVLLLHGRQAIVIDGFADRSRIRSYSLVDGAQQWTAPFAGDTTSTYVTASSTTVIASFDADVNTGTASSVAYDLRTGKERWQQPGFAGHVLDDGGVVITAVPEAVADTPVGAGVIKVVEQSTGAVRWQEPVGAGCQLSIGGDTSDPPSSFVEFCLGSGAMTVRDLATGVLRAQRVVRRPSTTGGLPTAGTPAQIAVIAIGDLTIVEDFEALETIVNAYRTSDTALMWSRRTWPNVYYYPCDNHLCQTGDAPSSDAVIDPRTGAVIAGLTVPVAPDDPPVTVGTTVTSTMLELLPDADAPRIPARGFFVSYAAPVLAEVGVNMPVGPTGSTWVVRQQGAALRPIQKLTGVIADACVAFIAYVACSMPSQHLALWRLP